MRAAIALGLVAGALLAAAPASAEMYFTKREAQSNAIDFGHAEYGIARWRLVASCDPVGSRYDPDYQYHRWRCVWGTNSRCWGGVMIKGNRSGSGWYSHREDVRYRCRRT